MLKFLKNILLSTALLLGACFAEPPSQPINVVGVGITYQLTAPSGACGSTATDISVIGPGSLYSCQNGIWAQISGGGGGGISGLTSPFIPYATSSTTIANSDLQDIINTLVSSAVPFQAPLQDANGQVCNVLAYGADPTGATANTDTVVLPAAVAACANSSHGGVVYFPPGRYAFSTAGYVLSTNNISIAGAGRSSTLTQAAQVSATGTTQFILKATGVNQRITTLTFAGQSTLASDSSTFQDCIETAGSTSLEIDNNIFTGLTPGTNGCNRDIFDGAGSVGTQMLVNNIATPPIGTIGSKGYGLLESGGQFQYVGNYSGFTAFQGRHHVYLSQSGSGTNGCSPASFNCSASNGIILGNTFVGGTNAVVECNASDTGSDPPVWDNIIGLNNIDSPSMVYGAADVGALDYNANCKGNKYIGNEIDYPGGGIATGVVNTSGTAVTWVSGNIFGISWSGSITINGTIFTISSCASGTACTLTGSAGTLTGVNYSFTSNSGAGISGTGDSTAAPAAVALTGSCVRTNNLDVITIASHSFTVGETVTVASTAGGTGSIKPNCNGTGFFVVAVTTNTFTLFGDYGSNTTTTSATGTVQYTPARAEDTEIIGNKIVQPTATAIVCAGCSKNSIVDNKNVDAGVGGTYLHGIWLAALNSGQIGASFNRVIGNVCSAPNFADYCLVIDSGSVVTANGNYVTSNYFPAGSTGGVLDNGNSTVFGVNFISGSNTLNGLAIPISAALLATNSSGQLTALTTVPTSTIPAFTGDMTNSAGSLSTTVGRINGTTFAGTSGHFVSFGAANIPADSGVVSANAVVASSPGAGIARFAGSTQTVTSSELSGDATTSGSNAVTVTKANGIPLYLTANTTAMGGQTTGTPTAITNMTWNIAANKVYDLQCEITVTFAASATIAFELLGPGSPTVYNLSASGNTGAAGAFQKTSTVLQVAWGTATTTTGAPAASEQIHIDAFISNGSTASGTALTLNTIADGTHTITVKSSSCWLMQMN